MEQPTPAGSPGASKKRSKKRHLEGSFLEEAPGLPTPAGDPRDSKKKSKKRCRERSSTSDSEVDAVSHHHWYFILYVVYIQQFISPTYCFLFQPATKRQTRGQAFGRGEHGKPWAYLMQNFPPKRTHWQGTAEEHGGESDEFEPILIDSAPSSGEGKMESNTVVLLWCT